MTQRGAQTQKAMWFMPPSKGELCSTLEKEGGQGKCGYFLPNHKGKKNNQIAFIRNQGTGARRNAA